MAQQVGIGDSRLRRINIPVPNPGLADWLTGSECYEAVYEVTSEIFQAYRNTLPVRTGNLRAHAYWRVEIGGFGNDHDRWVGRVGNDAVSYRPRRGYHYGRFIEYGKPTRGIPGQGQLRRAAAQVAASIGSAEGFNIPGVSMEPRGRGSRLRGARGRFVANPLARDA